MRQGGEPQGVQVVRQGEPTPYHCNLNRLYLPYKLTFTLYPNRLHIFQAASMLNHNQQPFVILFHIGVVLAQFGNGFDGVHHSGVVAPAECVADGRQ